MTEFSRNDSSGNSFVFAQSSSVELGPTQQQDPQQQQPQEDLFRKKPKKMWCHALGELHLRIFAWTFQVLTHVGYVMCVFGFIEVLKQSFSMDEDTSSEIHDPPLYTAGVVFSLFQYCFMPLMLIANFSQLFRDRSTLVTTLLKNGACALGVFLAFLFVYFRYAVLIVKKVTGVTGEGMTTSEASALVDRILSGLFGFLRQLSYFVDYFNCSLIAFFLLYKPKKYFQGDKIRIFRSLVLIPIIWSIVGYILLGVNNEGTVIPGYIYPLIPLKPPVFLLAYLLLVLYLKDKEQRFLKSGKTEEEFDKDFFSPESVRSFSIFASATLGICSVIDFIILLLFIEDKTMQRIGFGNGSLMFLVIPIILFYDYGKKMKDGMTGTLITLIGFAAIAIVWVEGIYWLAAWVIDVVKAFVAPLLALLEEEESVPESLPDSEM